MNACVFFFDGLTNELAVVFAEVLSEEVEPLVDMGDAGLVG